MGLLDGRAALITGSTRGIGRSIAEAFSSEGANVVVTSRKVEDAEALADDLRSRFGTTPEGVSADVSRLGDVKRLFLRIDGDYGGLEILVNNAGYGMVEEYWERSSHLLGDEVFRKVAETDLMGAVRCSREALARMMKGRPGRGKGGSIINISSTPAIAGYEKGAPYTLAKAAVIGMTKHLAHEYGRYGIRVNAVAPGNIRTVANYGRLSESERRRLARESPMRRWGEPKEVAGVCLFLASDLSSFVNGQTIVVDGGTVTL